MGYLYDYEYCLPTEHTVCKSFFLVFLVLPYQNRISFCILVNKALFNCITADSLAGAEADGAPGDLFSCGLRGE